jgi:hypothetical protein
MSRSCSVVIKWQVLTLFIIKTITMSDFLSWDTDLDLVTCLHNTLLISETTILISADYEFTPFEVLEILKQLIN